MASTVRKWKGCKVLEPRIREWHGAKSGVVDPTFLSEQVWPGVQYGTAFAYLFRRFGETRPFDWHKQLCNYDLTTPDKEVGFWLSCSPSSVGVDPGYWVSGSIYQAIYDANEHIQARDWPPVDPAKPVYGSRMPPEGTVSRRVIDAIAEGMRDLLRPVYVRDVPINILGRLTDEEASKFEFAEHAWRD